jgi:DNA-binding MarR family transcriptional regulator
MAATGHLGVAFLLAQLGSHATERFAARMAALDLNPAQIGLLRAIATSPGESQQALGRQLGLQPARMVGFVDELEQRGLVERKRNPSDRRQYALHLTAQGGQTMRRIAQLARAHEDEICAGLDEAERDRLRELLSRVADKQGLTPGVHPGYRRA